MVKAYFQFSLIQLWLYCFPLDLVLPWKLSQAQEGPSIIYQMGGIEIEVKVASIEKITTDVAVFAGGPMGTGEELVVGHVLSEAGAKPGIDQLNVMFKALPEPLSMGEILTAPSGGGNSRCIVEAATQLGPQGEGIEELKKNPKFSQLSRKDLSNTSSVLTHTREQGYGADAVYNTLLMAHTEPARGITDITFPFLGTGSFHGMPNHRSLMGMMSGASRFAADYPEARFKLPFIVWDGDDPGNVGWPKFLKRMIWPVFESKLWHPDHFPSYQEDFNSDPLGAFTREVEHLEGISDGHKGPIAIRSGGFSLRGCIRGLVAKVPLFRK